MNKLTKTLKNGFRRSLFLSLTLVLTLFTVQALFLPRAEAAGQLTARKLAIGTSAGNTATTWTFTFSATEATALNGITFQVCTSASGACTIPTSWTNGGSAFSTLTYNGSNQTGWTLDNAAGFLRIKNNASAVAVTNPVVVTFTTVTNPNTTNETFFARILTYSGDDFTSQVDNGVVAASTTQQISLTGTMDESLVFCTGTSITGTNCATVSGSAVNFGTFSSTTPSTGTSVMAASTNGVSGYTITINGATMTCTSCAGSPTIAALASQTASSPGTAQFGANLRDNATPNVGTEPSGSGSGTYTANYGTVDQFRFVTADSVASSAAATNANTFTVSYLVNVPGSQAAGVYTATMTFICTATF